MRRFPFLEELLNSKFYYTTMKVVIILFFPLIIIMPIFSNYSDNSKKEQKWSEDIFIDDCKKSLQKAGYNNGFIIRRCSCYVEFMKKKTYKKALQERKLITHH